MPHLRSGGRLVSLLDVVRFLSSVLGARLRLSVERASAVSRRGQENWRQRDVVFEYADASMGICFEALSFRSRMTQGGKDVVVENASLTLAMTRINKAKEQGDSSTTGKALRSE